MSDEKPTSIWKKEMSFRRKSEEERRRAAPPRRSPPSDPTSPSPARCGSKEFSLRKKPKDAPSEPEAVAAASEPGARAAGSSSPRVVLEPVARLPPLPVFEPARVVDPCSGARGSASRRGAVRRRADARRRAHGADEAARGGLRTARRSRSLLPSGSSSCRRRRARWPSADDVVPSPGLARAGRAAFHSRGACRDLRSSRELDLDLGLGLDLPVVVADVAPVLVVASRAALPFRRSPTCLPRPAPTLPGAAGARLRRRSRPESERSPVATSGSSRASRRREGRPKAEKAAEGGRAKRERAAKAEQEPATRFRSTSATSRSSAAPRNGTPPSRPPSEAEAPKSRVRCRSSRSEAAFRATAGLASRRQREEDRRPEDRRLPDRSGPHPQQRAFPELIQGGALRRSSRGVVVGGELRDPEALAVTLKDFFRRCTSCPSAASASGIANNRIGVRTFDVGRHRRSQAAGERGPVPRPGGAPDSDRGSGAGLSGAVGVGGTRDGQAVPPCAARRRLSRACRPLRLRLPQGRVSRSSASISRRSASSCAPISEPHDPGAGRRARRRRRRLGRP